MELFRDQWEEELKKVKPAIKNLYYKGNIKLLTNGIPRLAVVGSRKMTDYGRRVIERWMRELVKNGVVIVSGFMYGVDQTAHRSCIEEGGKTIAVLGWGIDRRVAEVDRHLYQKILESDGLIVSEWSGEMAGSKWSFPKRDRIIAGMSDAVWVVEGAPDSGSMITARQARSQNKKLLALPGQVETNEAKGVNELIKTGQASMTTSVDDLLKAMDLGIGQLDFNLEE